MYGSITTMENTITSAQDRVVELKFQETEIVEEIPEGENPEGETAEVEEETNSYNKKELAIIITSSVILSASFILIIYATMVFFGGIKNINSFKVAFTYALLVIILSEAILLTTINYSDKNYLNGKSFEIKALKKEQAFHVINKETEELDKVYEGLKQNESVLKITDEATYIGTNLDITKTSGKLTSKKEEVNNCVLATNSSKVTIQDSNITSNNKDSSAIYATKINTIVELTNVNITTTKDNSKGIVTKDNSELTIKDSTINTTGKSSELVSSSSNIDADNITGTTNTNIATIFQANKITLNNSFLETNLLEDKKGLFTISSLEEEYSDYTNAQLFLENNTIKVNNTSEYFKTTPLLYVENTNSKINLDKNKITYGNEILLSVITSNKYRPKTTTTLTITDTTIKGNILVDTNSEARINLNNVTYTGTVNGNNESQSVDVILDKTSKWYVTGHSYINKLQFQRNTSPTNYIYSYGYNIYYNASNNPELNNRTIYLPGGGRLIPVNKAS
jgi:hypothetical protein